MEPAATETWQWADSLDALEAASEFHSSEIRLLNIELKR